VISVVGITAGLFATRLSWFILDSAYHSLFGVDPYRSSLGLEGLATATLGSAICAALGGLVLGCAQWLVLRRYVERAGQWITGSTAAAAAAAMGVILILWVVLIFGFIQGWGFIYLYLFGIGCMPWPIMAGITGWVLLKLLKEPERPDTTIWTQSTETK
jgi:peptidoglycan biosynthesis protein MviN/MurJ (putative lipid II flippase)